MKIDFQKQKLLPPEIIDRLREMIRRIRRIQIIRGALATLGMALATSLTVMAVDAAVVIYSDTLRALFSLGALVITAFTAWMSLIRPLCDRITLVRMARILETRHPELHERISSALELLSTGEGYDSGDGASALDGNELYALLAQDAKKDIDSVSVRSEFRGTTIRPAAILASITFAILCFLFAAWPKQTALLFVRAVAPAHPSDNLAARLFTVTPGDLSVYSGESVVFTLTVPGTTSSRAELCVEYDESSAIERLSRRLGTDDSNAIFEMKMTAVKGTFRYRMRLGDALTRYYTITAIPPPAHADLNYRFVFPEYTGLGSTQFVASVPLPIRVPHGTHATITTTCNRKLDSALLLGDLRTIAPVDTPDPAPGDPQLLAFDWMVTTNAARSWSLALREFTPESPAPAKGSDAAASVDSSVAAEPPIPDFDDSDLPEFLRAPKAAAPANSAKTADAKPWIVSETASYEAVPDYPPHLQLAYPSGNSYVLPTYGLLKMVFEARDDYGFTSATLMVQPDNYRTPWEVDVEAEKIDNRNWCITKNLALDEFQLSGARKLRIWLEISDNLPPELGGPNKSRSRVIALNIDNSQNRSLADQVRIPERDSINELLNAAAAKLEATAEALKQGKTYEKIEEERAAEEANYLKQLEQRRENEKRGKSQQEIAAMSRETPKSIAEDQKMASPEEQLEAAAKIADEGLFAGIASDIAAVAEEKAAEALAAAADIAIAEEEERAKATEDAIAALIAAADATREMLPEVEKKDKILGEAALIDEIAIREARLAEQASSKIMTEEEKAAWQKSQEELAAKVDALDFIPAPESVVGEDGAAKADAKAENDATAATPDNVAAQPKDEAKPNEGYDLANDVDKDAKSVVAPTPDELAAQEQARGQAQNPQPAPAESRQDDKSNETSPSPAAAQTPAADEQRTAANPAEQEQMSQADAVSFAQQAKEALAAAPKRDDNAIRQAREAENIARQAKESIANSRNAIENTDKMEKEREAFADIQKKAESVRDAAEAAENAALEVKMQAEAVKTEAMPEDIRKALDLVRETEALADQLDKLPPAEAAAKAAALAAEAEKILESPEAASNPFLKKAAEQAAQVAKKAEEVVSALRAADREGVAAEKAEEAKEKAKSGTEEAKDVAENAASDLAMAMLTPQEAAVKLAQDAADAAKSAENAIQKLTEPTKEEGADANDAATKDANAATNDASKDAASAPEANPAAKKDSGDSKAADHSAAEDAETAAQPKKPDLNARDMEKQARQAQEATDRARRAGANLSADAADRARNANLEAKQAMDAIERAAQAKAEGKTPQYEQLVNEAKRHADRAREYVKGAEERAAEVGEKASEHAIEAFQNAADAAEKIADEIAKANGLEDLAEKAPALAARESDQAKLAARAEEAAKEAAAAKDSDAAAADSSAATAAKDDGKAKQSAKDVATDAKDAAKEGEGTAAADSPAVADAAKKSAERPAAVAPRERGNAETAELAKAAREAAQKAERAASDAREDQPAKAAQAARELAQKAENAENQLKMLQGNNSPEAKAQRENLLRDLEETFKRAEQLAALASETPGEQIADMARLEKNVAEDLAETAREISDLSKTIEEAKSEKRTAQDKLNTAKGDQRIIDEAKAEMEAADKKAAEAKEKLAEAAKEADEASRELRNQADRMQPVIQNAQRLGKKNETDAATQLRNDMRDGAQMASDLRNAANAAINGNGKYGEDIAKKAADKLGKNADKADEAADKYKPENGLDPLANAVSKAAEAGKAFEDALAEIPDYNRIYDAAVANFQAKNQPVKPADTLRDRLGDAVQRAVEAASMMPEDSDDANFLPSDEKPFDNEAVENIEAVAERAEKAAEAARSAAAEAGATYQLASDAMTNRVDAINKSLGRAESLGKDSNTRAAKFLQNAERAAKEAEARKAALDAQKQSAAPGSEADAPADAAAETPEEALARQFSPERSYALASALTNATAMANAIAEHARAHQAEANERLAALQSANAGEATPSEADSQQPTGEQSDARQEAAGVQSAGEQMPAQTGDQPARESANAQQDASAAPQPLSWTMAQEAAANAERDARAMLAPDAAQKEAARLARKAASGIKRMAAEHAKRAGLDPQTMRPKREGGKNDKSDKSSDNQSGKAQQNNSDEPVEPSGENTLPPDADDFTLELPEFLRRLGFPASEWVKYKNSLDSGMLESALDKVAPEYRDLVRRYFQILATDQGK